MSEQYWLDKLRRLNTAHGTGPRTGKAPHKPLLLLSLFDAFEADEIEARLFTRTPELVVRFLNYSAISTDRWPGKLKIKMPFFHLSSQQFWVSFDTKMNAATVDSAFVNELDEKFFSFCQQPAFRLKARCILIAEHFTEKEQVALFAAVGLGDQAVAQTIRNQIPEDAPLAEAKGRSTRFRSDVVIKYHRTCALTGYRCDTTQGSSIVDAAHIVPFSKSQNDQLQNGLALSKNAHWMFDEGLWAVSDDFRVLVQSKRFVEVGPDTFLLRNLKGNYLQFDPNANLRPSKALLSEHRRSHSFSA